MRTRNLPANVREFGNGKVIIGVGTFQGKPMLWVSPATIGGEVGATADGERHLHSIDKLDPEDLCFVFPTEAQAKAVEAALLNTAPSVSGSWGTALMKARVYVSNELMQEISLEAPGHIVQKHKKLLAEIDAALAQDGGRMTDILTVEQLDVMRTKAALRAIRSAKDHGLNEVGQAIEMARAIRRADEVSGLVVVPREATQGRCEVKVNDGKVAE